MQYFYCTLNTLLHYLGKLKSSNLLQITPYSNKKAATRPVVVTSSIRNRFLEFFHHWKSTLIFNKMHIIFLNTP